MKKHHFNIFFHLHTVSGIVLSVLLFVICFAGSFSFFRDDIVNWERQEKVETSEWIDVSINTVLDSLDKNYDLTGRDFSIAKPYAERRINITLNPSSDSLATEAAKTFHFFYLDTKTFETSDYFGAYSLGEFLYRLHFFAQIPYPVGYYLSGFSALFFVFILLTGLLIHWEKIISNFYTFRPWAKMKAIWTDAHTALGTIGLPFQLVYALTGAFFMIKALLVAPVLMVLYDNDQSRLYQDLEFEYADPEYSYQPFNSDLDVEAIIKGSKVSDFNLTKLDVKNFGDESMQVIAYGKSSFDKALSSETKIVFSGKDQTTSIIGTATGSTSYLSHFKNLLYQLHYANYGGYLLRITSFLLGIVTCFVIISGVLIWLTARDKKNKTEKQRRFYNITTRIYLAVCLSMLPVTALSFLAVKITPEQGQGYIYSIYFITWLILSLGLSFVKNNALINKICLFSGGILALCVPLCDGLFAGQWLWNNIFESNKVSHTLIDSLWFIIGVICLYITTIKKVETAK